MSVVDTKPRILFSRDERNGKYRVVLNNTRVTLEYKDTDAAGGVRWLNIKSWDRKESSKDAHGDIAMEIILSNLDSLIRELKIQDGEPL